MEIILDKVNPANESVFRNLWQYLAYDFSLMTGMAVGQDGSYALPDDYDDYHFADHYSSFIIRVNQEPAGLAVIRHEYEDQVTYFRHYFIMGGFRRKGLGQEAAHQIFDLYPGKWRVSQFDYNQPAIKFWSRTLDTYTGGTYTRGRRPDDRGPQQEFYRGH